MVTTEVEYKSLLPTVQCNNSTQLEREGQVSIPWYLDPSCLTVYHAVILLSLTLLPYI